ncbi:reverse transcriptase domain-containing protein [Tanacetum coccineum]
MAEEDEDKTTFFAGEGVYCYRKMPFGLKYAGATYQRLVDKVFNDQIGRNLEAYIDDMVIKSTSEEDMLADKKETFQRFQSINMKLNPKKCSFSVEEGPFLGHLITKQGIRANPSKVKAITDIEQPKMLKDIQSLNRKLAALSRFLSKGAERSLPFFKGIYSAKQPTIREYLQRTKETLRRFRYYTIEHIRRNQNKKADALSKLASMTFEHLTKEVLVEVLARRSIEEKEVLQVETKEEESWMTLIHEYLLSGLLPEDPKESRKIRIKVPQYKLIKGSLYKKSFYTSWLRCIAPPKTNDVTKEIHEGYCGFNTELRSMVVRITKQGYYWPSMHRDVSRIIQDCEQCKEQSVVKKRAEIGAIAAGNA